MKKKGKAKDEEELLVEAPLLYGESKSTGGHAS